MLVVTHVGNASDTLVASTVMSMNGVPWTTVKTHGYEAGVATPAGSMHSPLAEMMPVGAPAWLEASVMMEPPDPPVVCAVVI
jgi:hypothetical protein